jgi:hypothetical protein
MKDKLIFCLVIAATGYFYVTVNGYAWTHPWKTNTQVFQHIPQSLALNFDDKEGDIK